MFVLGFVYFEFYKDVEFQYPVIKDKVDKEIFATY